MKCFGIRSLVVVAIIWAFQVHPVSLVACRADDVAPAAQAPPAAGGAPQDAAVPDPSQPMSRDVFGQLIQQKDYVQAFTRLEAMIDKQVKPDETFGMSMMLSISLGREASDQAKEILHAIIDRARLKESWDPSTAVGVAYAVDGVVNRDQTLSVEDKLAMFDWLTDKLPSHDPRLGAVERMVLFRRITLLANAGRQAEALGELDKIVDRARSKIDPNDSGSISQFVDAVTTFQSLGGNLFPDNAAAVIAEATELVDQAIRRPGADLQIHSAYFKLKLSIAAAESRNHPKACAEILDDLEAKLKDAEETLGPTGARAIANYGRSISSLRSRIEATLKLEKLIGTEAPEIEAEHFVAQAPVTMAELRGKVVLIDFWAVWCGPCIATFPHLIDWHEKYSDRGLVILGATRFYNFQWDEETQRPVRADRVPAESELAMLENFRNLHKLHHGFFVTPKDSLYEGKFKVTGIPHAVLIDKSGKISLVRVGSGEANARDIETKIEELLD